MGIHQVDFEAHPAFARTQGSLYENENCYISSSNGAREGPVGFSTSDIRVTGIELADFMSDTVYETHDGVGLL